MKCPSPLFLRSLYMSVALAAVSHAGCGSPVGCGAGVYPAVHVFVRDAMTGAPAAEGAAGTIRDGEYVEALRVHATDYPQGPDMPGRPLSLAAGIGRPGTYTVSIEKDGYQPWEVSGIRARNGPCGVETVVLTAHLQPVN